MNSLLGRKLTFLGVGFALASNLYSQPSNSYIQHNLVSDLPTEAEDVDHNLVNPWGIAFPPTGPFWISDNRTGVSTLYTGTGEPAPLGNPFVVTIPPPGTNPSAISSPTGIVFNGTTSFTLSPAMPAAFLFATLDGTIAGWNPMVNATRAVTKVDNSGSGAIYTGLAMGSNSGANFLFAANFHAGTIDVFDANFATVTTPGAFTDSAIPAGFAPFNVQNIGGQLFVTFAMQNAAKTFDVAGAGNGFIDIFTTSGTLVKRLVSQGPLNSPWGMAMTPQLFGQFSNALLVGNFGDGTINAFDPSTGASLGQMLTPTGSPLTIPGLWALTFGNSGQGGRRDTLYFTAGIPGTGAIQDHGLFGRIRAQHP